MQQRRLAAIMFTDIVGYTTLMGSNEKSAFELLKKNRRIQWRLIKKYRGRWLKEMGDGILASFTSNIDAVMCAVSIQIAAQEMDIPLRIGIHQGDVIFEKKDVLGDGVNIASRIQGVINTNGIVISETVYNDIKNKEGIETEFLGAQTLKGVESPVGIYRVNCKDNSLLDYTIDTGELIRPLGFGRIPVILGIMIIGLLAYALYHFLPKITNPLSELGKSILVLPFDNFTGSDTLDYYVAGMHSSLITEIGKISALQVKSKTTANAYKNAEKSIPEIVSELDVNYIIEPSVLCLGDSICLQVKLVSTYPEEKQLWVQEFCVERSHILNLYNIVSKAISNEINVTLTPQEEVLLAEPRAVDPIAYDLYMKGQVYNDQVTKDALENAAQYFNLAIERDPGWAPPYAGLASVVARQYQMGFIARSIAIQKQKEYFSKALELDPNSSEAHNQIAGTAAWVEWDWEKAEKEFLKSLELNPNNSGSHMFYAHLLTTLRRTQEALHHAKIAKELDPLNPINLVLYGKVLIEAGDCQSALFQAEKALSIETDHIYTYRNLGLAAECLGDYEKAFEILKQVNYALWEEYEVTTSFEKIFHEHGWIAFNEELIKVNEEVYAKDVRLSDKRLADIYFTVKQYNRALDYYEKAFEIHSPNLPYISGKTIYDEMKDNPGYIELLKKMNLPVD